jgi:hypothetical protein
LTCACVLTCVTLLGVRGGLDEGLRPTRKRLVKECYKVVWW